MVVTDSFYIRLHKFNIYFFFTNHWYRLMQFIHLYISRIYVNMLSWWRKYSKKKRSNTSLLVAIKGDRPWFGFLFLYHHIHFLSHTTLLQCKQKACTQTRVKLHYPQPFIALCFTLRKWTVLRLHCTVSHLLQRAKVKYWE